jgi:hypothetical protein
VCDSAPVANCGVLAFLEALDSYNFDYIEEVAMVSGIETVGVPVSKGAKLLNSLKMEINPPASCHARL